MKVAALLVAAVIAAHAVCVAALPKDSAMNIVLQRIENRARSSHGGLRAPAPAPQALPEEQWFTQVKDHTGAVGGTWQQRYYMNDQYWKGPGAPIFLMVGGEGAISPGYVTSFYYTHYAEAEGALLIGLEHRFYGKSQPTGDLTTESLALLTSEQALADLNAFVAGMNKQLQSQASPWVTFGGSYPGSLSAWARSQYPNAIYASVSTSGPVQAELNFYQYLEVVKNDLHTFGGDECVNTVAAAFAVVEQLSADQSSWPQLQQAANACHAPGSTNDVGQLASGLADPLMGLAQYNAERQGAQTVASFCSRLKQLTSEGKQPLPAYLEVFGLNRQCMDYRYETMVQQLSDTQPVEANMFRQWIWQSCNEFGFFQTTDSPNQSTFGTRYPIAISLDLCHDVYGLPADAGKEDALMAATNKHYGSKGLQATNTFFVQGTVDPWHALGITTAPTESCGAAVGQWAHCANMDPPYPGEPSELAPARKAVGDWLHATLAKHGGAIAAGNAKAEA